MSKPSPRSARETAACREEFGDFFENSAIPFHCVAPDCTILAANKAELDLLGWSRREYVGAPVARFHDDPRVVEELHRRVARGETVRSMPARMKCRDGSVKDVLIDSNGRWDGGRLLHTRCVMRDVTEKKRAEEALRRSREDLERQVEARTAELRAALREYETFAYTVAHDLRAPLRSMQGFARILLSRRAAELPAEDRELFERIVAAGQRMDRLIADLLAYSRLSGLEFTATPIPLQAAVDQALAAAAPELRAAGAAVTVDRPLPQALAHAGVLAQALAHLLSNAAKFVAPGAKPAVRLRAERRGARVRLWVEDKGIGIPAEHHERIFRVFQRLHRQSAYPGTGIGLALVRRAAERLAGAAGVESAEGEGSRFWIELPEAPRP